MLLDSSIVQGILGSARGVWWHDVVGVLKVPMRLQKIAPPSRQCTPTPLPSHSAPQRPIRVRVRVRVRVRPQCTPEAN